MSTFWSKRRTTGKDRQVKKHYTQMSLQEKKKCVNLLQDTINTHKYLELSSHCKTKLKNKINFSNLVRFIFKDRNAPFNIIEYNITDFHGKEQRRIIFKSPTIVTIEGVSSYQYLVINLEDDTIITTYYNGITDTHKTLDLKYYNKNLTIK
ncbi:hypothetical protein vBSauMSDQ_0094 [Staphylococcus phage vB_SauM-SDQ]